MSSLAYLLVAGASPVSWRTAPLGVQVLQVVHDNLWGTFLTQEVGVTFEASQ